MTMVKLSVAALLVVVAAVASYIFFLRGPDAVSPAPAAAPTAELQILPAAVGQDEDGDETMPAVARFSPPDEGGEVVLQRRDDQEWVDVTSSVQDAEGVAEFVAALPPDNERHQYRAIATTDTGDSVSTSPVRVRLQEPSFEDDFDGETLDATKWRYRHLGARLATADRPCAESARSAVEVENGNLALHVQEIPPETAERLEQPGVCPHGEFYNGHIGTDETFRFKYGVMAARIQFSSQQGQHGAFWAQPVKRAGGAEIDAVEYFGDGFPAKGELAGSSAVQHSIYWESETGPEKVGGLFDLEHLLPAGETWSDSFHVFSVEWTPDEYIFRVDGRETFRTDEGVSEVKQYLILSLLTSDWELPRLDVDASSPMQVDWVRVWKHRPPKET